MAPIVDRLEGEFVGEVMVRRFDANQPENVPIQQAYELRGHPTFALLDGEGTVVKRYFGIVAEAELRQDMQAVIP